MYHPQSELDRDEWLELVNTGTNTVDLTGWRFTTGVRFTFPAGTTIPAGGFLAVAADAAAFTNRFPAVTNWVAGWSGKLSNSGQLLELQDAEGKTVESIRYADQGDWSVRVLDVADFGHRGWEWASPADGRGSSLELVQLALPGRHGQNWHASVNTNGTPGRANLSASNNVAPLILDVTHLPVVPRATDTVTVSAQLLDESTNLTAVLHWRRDGEAAFTAVPMADDGKHGDHSPGDGRFGAEVPAQPDGTIVEFYIEASDDSGHTRSWPAPGIADGVPVQAVNALYQVDSAVQANPATVGVIPIYRLIMTATNRTELANINKNVANSSRSHALYNSTFISIDAGGTSVRYNTGIRNRGNGSATRQPQSFRVNFRHDDRWKDVSGLNLNTQYTPNQLLGSALYRKAGVPAANSRPVRVRVNGETLSDRTAPTYGFYVANEVIESDFAARVFPSDSSGNIYRGIRISGKGADLHYEGAEPTPYRLNYFKQTNTSVDDWTDLIRLCQTLSETNLPAATWEDTVRQRVDIEEWMRYFAIETLVDNKETNLANGNNGTGQGDDFFLYFGIEDGRARVIPYDLDTILGVGDTAFDANDGLFRMNANPIVARFMQHPAFAAVYYRTLQQMLDGVFSAAELDPLIDDILSALPVDAQRATMKQFAASRRANLAAMIPRALSATNTTATFADGTFTATASKFALNGRADAAKTFSVRVNGTPADWSHWEARWTAAAIALHPGLNSVHIEALDAAGNVIETLTVGVRYDDGSVAGLTGTIATDRTLAASGGPYRITGTLTVGAGATLTIEPGTTLYLGSGANLVVADGGRILADGTSAAAIQFVREPGIAASWGGLVLNGSPGSVETRLHHVYFEGNGSTCIEVAGGTLSLDHATFGTTTHQYLALDGASFVVSHCIFPNSTAGFELVHGTKGIKAGGHGIIRHCFFGISSGYNDIIDFTGGNRDAGQPIIQFYNNVFTGATDDILDLDGTDAWVEGNIFLHVHQNGAPDSSSAVSGGKDGSRTSEITIIGNLFYDCDDAATAKEGNFVTLINNTVLRITRTGGNDSAAGVVNVRDFPSGGSPTTFGRGAYLEGNIIADVEQLVRNYDGSQTTVTFNSNLLPVAWAGPGTGNVVANPLFRHVPTLAETQFKTWEEAQVMWNWLSLRSGSPAIGTGPNGRDMGGVVPPLVSISGEPAPITAATSAILRVGVNRTGNAIPTDAWPNGSGYTHFRWSLDNGAWSASVPISTPITLDGLAAGTHQVRVVGRRDSDLEQDSTLLGDEAGVTLSKPWTIVPTHVAPAGPGLVVLNELLAKNVTYQTGAGDLIELHNPGPGSVDLAGYSLAQSPKSPRKFVFPAGSLVPAGGFLVVHADSASTPGLHTGFGLSQSGDAVYLYDTHTNLQDYVEFGLQLADFSIGRVAIPAPDGRANPATPATSGWILCEPTFGQANIPAPLGDARRLRITEWLTSPAVQFTDDYIELNNPEAVPVELGDLFITDNPYVLQPALEPLPVSVPHPVPPPGTRITPLSFVAAHAYQVLKADGQTSKGADHLGFKLDADYGTLALYETIAAPAPEGWSLGSEIDAVTYGAQYPDVSQGRSPGVAGLLYFKAPSPGVANPAPPTPNVVITTNEIPLLVFTNSWHYWQKGDPGATWHNPGFNDSNWPVGRAAFWYSDDLTVPFAFKTNTALTKGQVTFYFRTHFDLPTNAPGLKLHAEFAIDDGAAFWLNGQDIYRIRLDANATHNTAATRIGTPIMEGPFELPSAALKLGDNVLAVEVHESSATSGDGALGIRLWATITTTNDVGTITGPVVLNELLANNRGLREPDGRFADWIELHNPNTAAYPLAGLSLTDDLDTPAKFVFPAGAEVPPRGFLRVLCVPADGIDESQKPAPAGTLVAPFGLSLSGETVYLLDTPEHGHAVVDQVTYGPVPADLTLARIPDGADSWQLASPTPMAANQPVALGDPTGVRINEWMANPDGGEDWFELYNPDSKPVDLSGFHLTDELPDTTKHPLPSRVFIGAHGHLVFHADNSPQLGADHVSFQLAAKGEALGLSNPSGVLVDSVTFGAQAKGISEGRSPDGSDAIARFGRVPTPGRANETDADADGMADTWEAAHGLRADNPDDAGHDSDSDASSNFEEFIAGTDPQSAASRPAWKLIVEGDGSLTLQLHAEAGRAYLVQSGSTLGAGDWHAIGTVEARAIAHDVRVHLAAPSTSTQFIRLGIELR